MTHKINTQVLVVKHDSIFRCTIVDALSNEGFEVSVAETAEQAIEMLSGTPFDVLVAAMNMPSTGADPSDVIREGLAIYPHMATVAIASEGSVNDAIRAMKSGAQECLPKPFDVANLCASVRQLLAQRRN